MEKILTQCCSLCQLSAGNEDSLEELTSFIDKLREESTARNYYGQPNELGQKAVFCIVTPHERILGNNLRQLGFKRIHRFERRMGYPSTGLLKMYILNL